MLTSKIPIYHSFFNTKYNTKNAVLKIFNIFTVILKMIFFNNFNPKWSRNDLYGVHSLILQIIIDFFTNPKKSFHRILPYICVQA